MTTIIKPFTVTTLGLSGPEWIARLEKKKYHVSDWAKELLQSPAYEKHRLKKGQKVELSFIFHQNISRNPTTTEIQTIARAQGRQMPTAEIALLIREAISDEQMEKAGFWYIASLHDPITDSDGRPSVLSADRGDGGGWVDAYWDRPDGRWSDVGASAFPVSAQPLELLHSAPATLEPLNLELRVSALEHELKELKDRLRTV